MRQALEQAGWVRNAKGVLERIMTEDQPYLDNEELEVIIRMRCNNLLEELKCIHGDRSQRLRLIQAKKGALLRVVEEYCTRIKADIEG